jgi:hypothetical protein
MRALIIVLALFGAAIHCAQAANPTGNELYEQ